MNNSNMLAAVTLDDIVFARRNKAYGAYMLRKLYGQHLIKAAIIASTLFLLLVSMPLVARLLKGDKASEVITLPKERALPDFVIPTMPPPPLPETVVPTPPPAEAKPASRAQIKYTTPVVTSNQDVRAEEDLPEMDELRTLHAGTKTVEGVAGGLPDIGVPDGTGIAAGITDVVVEEPHIFAEQMPSFPGGQAAMFAFISKHIRYPQQAIRAGVEGTVYVSFVVSRTGEISEIEVLRGLGAGCDEEAIRVIKSMPDWTPGKQNGRTVPVRYNIPIKYTLK